MQIMTFGIHLIIKGINDMQPAIENLIEHALPEVKL